jgi:hypothetical protein
MSAIWHAPDVVGGAAVPSTRIDQLESVRIQFHSLRHESRFSNRSTFLVSDISFLTDISALFRSARRAALCTETNLAVIGLGVGSGSRF